MSLKREELVVPMVGLFGKVLEQRHAAITIVDADINSDLPVLHLTLASNCLFWELGHFHFQYCLCWLLFSQSSALLLHTLWQDHNPLVENPLLAPKYDGYEIATISMTHQYS